MGFAPLSPSYEFLLTWPFNSSWFVLISSGIMDLTAHNRPDDDADRQAGAATEVEITPEMIEAGLAAYAGMSRRFHLDAEIVVQVYRDMEAIRRQRKSSV